MQNVEQNIFHDKHKQLKDIIKYDFETYFQNDNSASEISEKEFI